MSNGFLMMQLLLEILNLPQHGMEIGVMESLQTP